MRFVGERRARVGNDCQRPCPLTIGELGRGGQRSRAYGSVQRRSYRAACQALRACCLRAASSVRARAAQRKVGEVRPIVLVPLFFGRDTTLIPVGVNWPSEVRKLFGDLPREKWSRRWDSNPRPADYESAALPTELRRLGGVIGARSQRTQTRHFSTAAPPLDPKNLLTSRSPVEPKPKKLLNF
jgi:hypothetical protein